MRCSLGRRKVANIRRMLGGRPVESATVRGGSPHCVAIVYVPVPRTSHPFVEEWHVNYRTGEVRLIDPAAEHRRWLEGLSADRVADGNRARALCAVGEPEPGSLRDDLRRVLGALKDAYASA